MLTLVFSKQANSEYLVIGDHTEDASANTITFSKLGIVVDRATGAVSAFGNVKQLVSNKRCIELSLAGDLASGFINGSPVSIDQWDWTDALKATGCASVFSFAKGNAMFLEADTPGVVVYSSDSAIIVVTFQFAVTSQPYGVKVPNKYNSVWFNGRRYRPGTDTFNAFFDIQIGKAHDTIKLLPGITRTEQFWVRIRRRRSHRVRSRTRLNLARFSMPAILRPLLIASFSTTGAVSSLPMMRPTLASLGRTEPRRRLPSTLSVSATQSSRRNVSFCRITTAVKKSHTASRLSPISSRLATAP